MRHIGKAMISAAFLAGLALSTQAMAMPVAKIYDIYPDNSANAERTGFVPEQQVILGGAVRLDRLNGQTAAAAAETYYDFDAIITIGSLALAGGALAGLVFSAKRREEAEAVDERREPQSGWRDLVMQNLEADLTAFVRNRRHAA
jgi:hypothetical protein